MFQTLLTGDSWGARTLPFIKKEPLFFCLSACSFVIVQLGFTNLVLSNIMDSAVEQRESMVQEAAEARLREEQHEIRKFYVVLEEMDEDKSGSLTIDETMHKFYEGNEFQDK
eukprot:TRINITY_DN22391_c0_g1_i1.p2 TRINITY_DN22391_c0_g1~~TRINITY_DN22391_c0_g1_i1.p2  ORF type:complete len:112 (-),score=25.94 TRINITY_DN22391_c0_g1_i1:117-452(-)